MVATNIILWLRTLIRESLEEISEVEEEHERDLQLHANETEIVGFVLKKILSSLFSLAVALWPKIYWIEPA